MFSRGIATGRTKAQAGRIANPPDSPPDAGYGVVPTAGAWTPPLGRDLFARLVPNSTRSLADIEAGKPPAGGVQRKLLEVQRVVEALSEVIAADAIGPWMLAPNEAFDGLKPREVIERGEVDRIWRMIFLLRSGAAL
jgi:hypothetical protein